MTRNEIFELIDGLTQDIYISYQGKDGLLVPLSRKNIRLYFNGGEGITADSVEEAMKIPFIDGKSIEELAEKLEIG